MLHLYDDETFFKPRDVWALGVLSGLCLLRRKSPLHRAAREGWAARIVLGNMAVMPVPGSRLVDVSYIDPSPARAQQVANGYAEAYIASNLDKRFDANSYAKTFLEDQVQQLKIRLEESEKALLDFAEQEKIVEVTDKTSIAENNLATSKCRGRAADRRTHEE